MQAGSVVMQPTIMEQIGQILLAQGLSGIIIIFLGIAVKRLYDRNQELHQTLYDIGRESVKANEATAAALNRQTDLLLRTRVGE